MNNSEFATAMPTSLCSPTHRDPFRTLTATELESTAGGAWSESDSRAVGTGIGALGGFMMGGPKGGIAGGTMGNLAGGRIDQAIRNYQAPASRPEGYGGATGRGARSAVDRSPGLF